MARILECMINLLTDLWLHHGTNSQEITTATHIKKPGLLGKPIQYKLLCMERSANVYVPLAYRVSNDHKFLRTLLSTWLVATACFVFSFLRKKKKLTNVLRLCFINFFKEKKLIFSYLFYRK